MRKYLFLLLFILIFILALCGTVSAVDGNTTLVSNSTTGTPGNDVSDHTSISADGKYIVFESDASNLVSGDTNGLMDIFLRNTVTNTTTRISVSSSGTQAIGGDSTHPCISADGNYVVFESLANNLVSNDTNGLSDIFLRNLITNTTTRISVSTSGAQATGGGSFNPVISGDGHYAVFASDATNLVTGDSNNVSDIFLRDVTGVTTTRLSVATGGAQSNDISDYPAISSNGQFIAFTSEATNLVTGDTNGMEDVFVRDRVNNITTRVSISTGNVQGNNISYYPSISSDGRYVAFTSDASNLVTGDINAAADVFVRDRTNNTTTRISVSSGGVEGNSLSYYPSISSDGRYVAFVSSASNLVGGDTNGSSDIFVHDSVTGETFRVSVATNGAQANSASYYPSISSNGKSIAFDSVATNLYSGDTNGCSDVFLHTSVGGVHPGGSIQVAINNAAAGDTIYVYDDNGAAYTYHESITVNKRLTIIANGSVTISGDLLINSPVVTITTAGGGSTIRGFTIRGASNSSGIYLNSSNSNIINGNTVTSNLNGIQISSSTSNTISGNSITSNNNYGIWLSSSTGNYINGSNQINSNHTSGIYLNQSDSNNISSNSLSSNPRGITVVESPTNTISGNQFTDGGISLNHSSMCVLRNNVISSTTLNMVSFEVISSDIPGFRQDINTSNTINGKQIRYIMDASGTVIDQTWNVGFLALIQCNNITVRGITIDNAGMGILLAGTTNSTIGGTLTGQGNTFTHNQVGIDIEQSTGNNIINNNVSSLLSGIVIYSGGNNTISGNTITSTNSNGITITSSNGNQIINNNQINNNGGYGISVSGSNNTTISGSSVQNNTNYGIYLINSGTNIISGNNISGNHKNGIFMDTSNNNQIIGNNQINTNTGFGIGLSASNGNTISSNTIQNNTDNGINLNSSGTNTISGNSVTGNTIGINLNLSNNTQIIGTNQINSNRSYGISLTDSDGNTISTNTLQSNNSYGMNLVNADNNIINGNSVINNFNNGLYLSTSTYNNINGNQITTTRGGNGIRLNQATNNTISGNTIQNNNTNGIYFASSSNNNTISGNTITGNNFGLNLTSSSNNIINGNNQINNNTGSGIRITSSNGNQISNNSIANNNANGIHLISTGTTTSETISGNNITGNQNYGIANYSSNSSINFNRIYNNLVSGLYMAGGISNAQYNWWGTNSPTSSDINISSGTCTYDPWMILTITAAPTSMYSNQQSTITADLLHDHGGTPHPEIIPYTGIVDFNTSLGTINDANMSNAVATSTLQHCSPGTADVTAQVDGALVHVYVNVGNNPTITNTANYGSLNVGESGSFTITVTNNSSNPLTNINITDVVPSGLTYTGYTSSIAGSYNSSTGLWTVGTVTSGSPAWLTITGTVNNTQAGSSIVNRATETQNDYPYTVTISDAAIHVKEADVIMTKTASISTPSVGHQFYYTITLLNNGMDAANSVNVTDGLPAGLTFNSYTATQGTYSNGIWNVGTLNINVPVTLTIYVTPNMATAGQTITNTATETQTEFDHTPATAQVTVNIRKAVELTKTGDYSTYCGNIIWRIYAENTTNVAFNNININDLITPASMTSYWTYYVSYNNGLSWIKDSSYNPTTGNWIINQLTAGVTYVLAIYATPLNGTAKTYTNTATYGEQQATGSLYIPDNVINTTKTGEYNTSSGQIIWRINITNNGNDTANNLYVWDLMGTDSPGTTYSNYRVSYNNGTTWISDGSYNPEYGEWVVNGLDKGEMFILEIYAIPLNGTGRNYTNTATDSFGHKATANIWLPITGTVNSIQANTHATETQTATKLSLLSSGKNQATTNSFLKTALVSKQKPSINVNRRK